MCCGNQLPGNAYKFIAGQVKEGRQAYVICPMVEESENVDAENVVEYAEKLKAALPPQIRVEYLHGKMKANQKEEIMARFAARETDVLVSTTVIEVGVNVPNATVMMVAFGTFRACTASPAEGPCGARKISVVLYLCVRFGHSQGKGPLRHFKSDE